MTQVDSSNVSLITLYVLYNIICPNDKSLANGIMNVFIMLVIPSEPISHTFNFAYSCHYHFALSIIDKQMSYKQGIPLLKASEDDHLQNNKDSGKDSDTEPLPSLKVNSLCYLALGNIGYFLL